MRPTGFWHGKCVVFRMGLAVLFPVQTWSDIGVLESETCKKPEAHGTRKASKRKVTFHSIQFSGAPVKHLSNVMLMYQLPSMSHMWSNQVNLAPVPHLFLTWPAPGFWTSVMGSDWW